MRKSAFAGRKYFMAAITRHAARECALKILYSYDFQSDESPEAFFALVCEEAEIPFDAFAKDLFCGTVAHMTEIDEKIAEYAKGWRLDRIAHVSLAVLRLCTYEMMYTEIPTPIAINEAVELAKSYDNNEAPAFINGILNTIAKKERGAET